MLTNKKDNVARNRQHSKRTEACEQSYEGGMLEPVPDETCNNATDDVDDSALKQQQRGKSNSDRA